MIYACDDCRFVFERTGRVDACPDCGKPSVREATEKEAAEYIRYRAEFDKEQKIEEME